jgi:hypothetical protein
VVHVGVPEGAVAEQGGRGSGYWHDTGFFLNGVDVSIWVNNTNMAGLLSKKQTDKKQPLL